MNEREIHLGDVFFGAVGKKYTTFAIGSMMAWTTVSRFTVNEVHEDRIIFTPKGKRKKYILRFASKDYATAPAKPYEGAIFAGWEHPYIADTEQKGGCMNCNACINIMGDVAGVREWFDASQLNPTFDRTRVIAREPDPEYGEGKETAVFADEYQGGHACIDRIIEAA